MTLVVIGLTILIIGIVSTVLVAGVGMLADLLLKHYASQESTVNFLNNTGDLMLRLMHWTAVLIYLGGAIAITASAFALVPYIWSLT